MTERRGPRAAARGPLSSSPPPPAADAAAVDALRADVEAWTVDAVHELLGPVAQAAMAREEAVPALRALRDRLDEPLAALTAVFVLGRPPSRRRLAAALPRLGVDGAVRLGLVEAAGSGAGRRGPPARRPPARTRRRTPAAPRTGGSPPTSASSPPAARSARITSSASAARPSRWPAARSGRRSAGCSTSAPAAASRRCTPSRHADAVVATDLSGRALAFARLNLALNGVRADLRQGDLLEPARGERFDLVVSNPPFVITPRTPAAPAYTYRDAGLAGDDVVSRLVTGVRERAAPRRRRAAARQLGGPRRRALGRARRRLDRGVRPRRLGGAARAAGPGAVRGAVDAGRR